MKYDIIQNLTNAGYAMCVLLLAWGANFVFGVFNNVMLKGQKWDATKMFMSLLKLVVFLVGLALLTSAITVLPIFASYVGLEIPEEYSNVLSTLSIISAVMMVSLKYIKEALTKFFAIIGYDEKKDAPVNYIIQSIPVAEDDEGGLE